MGRLGCAGACLIAALFASLALAPAGAMAAPGAGGTPAAPPATGTMAAPGTGGTPPAPPATGTARAGAAQNAAERRPPDPLAAVDFLAAQRAGFGSARQAADLAAAAQVRARALRARPRASALVGTDLSGSWQPLGPGPVQGSYYGGAVSGRVDAVAVAPSGEIFIGTAGGGVWSSTDGGAHWVTHTDGVSSGLAIGALDIDPTNAQTIYAGTGEADDCGDCFYGGGVLKSTDGGNTWTVENPGGIFSGVDFSAIAVDPGDPSHLYAATTAGLFESTDGGASWAHPSGTGDFTSAATALALDPATSPATVYVATAAEGIQESTDGGTNFTTLGGGLPAAANFGGAALAIGSDNSTYPTADQTLYAAVALTGITDPSGGALSMFKSTDGGATWTRLTIPAYTNQAYAYGTGSADQATFDNTIAVDPANPSHVIAGGIAAVESTDGGTTWSNIDGQNFFGSAANVVHPDFHGLAFTPSGSVVLGTDGGVFAYDPSHPGPAGVTNLNSDLNTALAYQDIGVYGNGTAILAGLQDNGTALYDGSPAWPQVLSGNGGYSAINPLDERQQYAESDGHLTISGDTWASAGADITPPGEPSTDANFVPPVAIVANSATPEQPTVYYGGADLWQTTDPADPTPSWTRLTTAGSGVSAIAVAPTDPAIVYVGFDDGTLEVSDNATSGSPTFTSLSSGVSEWITHIAVNPTDPGQIALSFSSSNTHTYAVAPMVLTASVKFAGTPSASFSDETGNLPTGVASNSVLFDGSALVLATDVGVFGTPVEGLNGASTTWSPVGTALPNVQVIGLTLDGAGDLYAATHGRGIWELPPLLSPPVVSAPPSISGSAVQGQTLSEQHGSWTPTPTSYSYQWLRCSVYGCAAIAGATGQRYTLTSSDVGFTLEVSETAAGWGGPGLAATSLPIGPVKAASTGGGSGSGGGGGGGAGGGGGGGGGSGSGGGSGHHGPPPPPSAAVVRAALAHALAPLAAVVAHAASIVRHGILLNFSAPGAGRLLVTWTVSGRGRSHTIVAQLKASFTKSHRARLRLVLTAAGRRLLASRRSLRVLATGTFQLARGRKVTVTRWITLHR